MSDKVIIFDTTLRDGEQCPGASMNLREKMEIARQLQRLNVDVIEAGFPCISDGDFEAVQKIATEIRGPVIAGLARCVANDIDAAGAAVKPAGDRGRYRARPGHRARSSGARGGRDERSGGRGGGPRGGRSARARAARPRGGHRRALGGAGPQRLRQDVVAAVAVVPARPP